MIILDENILESERLALESSRSKPRQIGVDLGRKGLKDEEIIVLLRSVHVPTFFTRDADFYFAALSHRGYCLVVLDATPVEVAIFVRRFLRHPDFNTRAKRMGAVVRVSRGGLSFWSLRSNVETNLAWNKLRQIKE